MDSAAIGRLSNLQRHLFPQPCSSNSHNPKDGLIKISPEVSDALSHGAVVVAPESTIICHGMPYPQKLETTKEIEGIVRENGAIPATIAILDGVPHIGLHIEELERLAKLGAQVRKTARRDIAAVASVHYGLAFNMITYHDVAAGANGATTVSATMYFASMVAISVFVTGGIGGVHRHGERTMDVSSDLTELGKTPVAVVSAETSGCKVRCRLDSPEAAALLIEANMKLKLGTGILIAAPIPKEHSASGNFIESAIQRALKEAREKNMTGSAETPFVLSRVNQLTGGASLTSNIALVKNNATIGSKIAVCLPQLGRYSSQS